MDQDWHPVVFRKNNNNNGVAKVPQSATALAKAKLNGQVEVVQKVQHTAPTNAHRLDDNELPDFKMPQVTQDFKIALMKARQAKSLSQKDLAAKLNVKPSIINDYESGKAIPQGAFICQLNRVLGVVLPKIPKKK